MEQYTLSALCALAGLDAVTQNAILTHPDQMDAARQLLAQIPDLCQTYKVHGIPQEVLQDTLADFRFWISPDRVKNAEWLSWHLGFRLFQLGRLQYILRTLPQGISSELPAGTEVLDVHIPQGNPLTTQNCTQSLQTAVHFFKTYFSSSPKAFVCKSWLLCPTLREVLDASAGILQFQSLFTVYGAVGDDSQMYDRVFGCAQDTPNAQLPRHTRLQKNIAHSLQQGKHFPMCGGYILL